ncbi:MAG: hypothetical protein PSW75_02540 [bacterium]|nr:hypothetical protein [bacterium]MDI1337052.1 hypothetical protein [Lacunisphaera sp.]
MKSSSLVSVAPRANIFSPRRVALALTAIVTLLAFLATPLARAEDKPAATEPGVVAAGALPPVNHLVYLDLLPTPAALIKEAKAQGTTITRIDRTDDSVVVVYKYADGRTDTFGYTTLATASTQDEPAAVTPSTAAPAVRPAPPTYTVISYEPAPVYYAPRYRYYDPVDNFWGPLVLGVGIGWVTGGHGGYHGGHHGGWRH